MSTGPDHYKQAEALLAKATTYAVALAVNGGAT
jgi:hypothetical protein